MPRGVLTLQFCLPRPGTCPWRRAPRPHYYLGTRTARGLRASCRKHTTHPCFPTMRPVDRALRRRGAECSRGTPSALAAGHLTYARTSHRSSSPRFARGSPSPLAPSTHRLEGRRSPEPLVPRSSLAAPSELFAHHTNCFRLCALLTDELTYAWLRPANLGHDNPIGGEPPASHRHASDRVMPRPRSPKGS